MDATPEMTKRKLLLADDSVTIRKVVELTFAEEGIEVISATNGDEAMQRFVERTPDIVLVDVEMPGMSGYKICEMIKGDESTKDIPVLLLVGSFEPFDQDEAERVLADGFLMKPFHSIRELVAKVNELLGDDGARMPTADTEDIEDLYSSSFSETVPLDMGDTDEDLSQVSYVADETVEELPLEQESHDEPVRAETLSESTPEDAHPYLDNELLEMHPVSQEPIEEEDLGEPSFDDEIVETIHASPSASSNGFMDSAPTDAFESTVRDFDWSPEAKVTEAEVPEAASAPENEPEPAWEPEPAPSGTNEGARLSLVPESEYVDPAIHDSISDTEEFRSPYAVEEIERAVEPVNETPEPSRLELSEETINLLAKRIVEKLSDRVIRDVAQEAVPRIAEKLIREALDDEGKS